MTVDLNLNFLGVSVVDWHAAYQFYTEVLGIRTADTNPIHGDWAMLGGGWDAFHAGSKSMIFELFDGAKPQTGTVHQQGFRPGIHVDDLEAAVSTLRERGVQFTTAVERRPYGTYIEFVATEAIRWSLATLPNAPSGSLEIPYIGHVTVKAHDRAAQVTFYRDVMGLNVLADETDYTILQRVPGEPLLIIEPGGQQIIPDPNWPDPVRAQPVFISIMTPDVDHAHALFIERDCRIIRQITRHESWGGTDVLVADADGNVLQVVQYG